MKKLVIKLLVKCFLHLLGDWSVGAWVKGSLLYVDGQPITNSTEFHHVMLTYSKQEMIIGCDEMSYNV